MAYVRTQWIKGETNIDAVNLNNVEEGIYELDAEYYKKLKELDDSAPKGPTGQQGPDGDPGNQGPKGADGDDGATGSKGQTGDQGGKGADGDQGDQGLTGGQGSVGATGNTGPDGDTGGAGADYNIETPYTELDNKSIIVSLNELYDSIGLISYGFNKGEGQTDNSHIIFPSTFMNIKQNDIFNIKSTGLNNLDFSTNVEIATYFEITTISETEVKLKCIKALEDDKVFNFKATTDDETATEIVYTIEVHPNIDLSTYKLNIPQIDKTLSRESINIYNFKPGVEIKVPVINAEGDVISAPVKGRDFMSIEIDSKVSLNEATVAISTAVAETDASYVMKIFFTESTTENFCTVTIHTGNKPA